MQPDEHPSVEQLASREEHGALELLRREFETFVEGQRAIERLRLERERSDLHREKRRIEALLQSTEGKIAQVERELVALAQPPPKRGRIFRLKT